MKICSGCNLVVLVLESACLQYMVGLAESTNRQRSLRLLNGNLSSYVKSL